VVNAACHLARIRVPLEFESNYLRMYWPYPSLHGKALLKALQKLRKFEGKRDIPFTEQTCPQDLLRMVKERGVLERLSPISARHPTWLSAVLGTVISQGIANMPQDKRRRQLEKIEVASA